MKSGIVVSATSPSGTVTTDERYCDDRPESAGDINQTWILMVTLNVNELDFDNGLKLQIMYTQIYK